MPTRDATIDVRLGFMPSSLAIPDVDHPGLLRAGPRASAPYGGESVEVSLCPATDLCQEPHAKPDLLDFGFDTADLSTQATLQQAFTRVEEAGRITDADASAIRAALGGATLRCASGATLSVLHVADEGLIMRKAGPNGLSLVGPRSRGMNDHGVATSVHADQDVYGTPLTQLMEGRAPSLFRHVSPDGQNLDADLMLVNLWIPLRQIVQPLVLADGRTIDRRRHQLRYGLATTSFLDREDDMAINDIWTFLHDDRQQWYFHSEMDHRHAYVFNTLSTPHGAGMLPGEDVAELCYRALEDGESAAAAGDASALAEAVAPALHPDLPVGVPPALAEAISTMATVAREAGRDPAAVCRERVATWSEASQAARRRVIRMSLELRMVVAVDGADRDAPRGAHRAGVAAPIRRVARRVPQGRAGSSSSSPQRGLGRGGERGGVAAVLAQGVDGEDGEHADEDRRRFEGAAGDEPGSAAGAVALDHRVHGDRGADAGEGGDDLDEVAPQHALVAAGTEDEARVVDDAVVERQLVDEPLPRRRGGGRRRGAVFQTLRAARTLGPAVHDQAVAAFTHAMSGGLRVAAAVCCSVPRPPAAGWGAPPAMGEPPGQRLPHGPCRRWPVASGLSPW